MTKYVTAGTARPKTVHEDPECSQLEEARPVEDDEIPSIATKCAFCADGLYAADLRGEAE